MLNKFKTKLEKSKLNLILFGFVLYCIANFVPMPNLAKNILLLIFGFYVLFYSPTVIARKQVNELGKRNLIKGK